MWEEVFLLRALCARGGVQVRGFLPALHSVKGALGKIEISIVVRGSERKNPEAKAGSHRRTDLKYMTLSKKKKKCELNHPPPPTDCRN